MEFITNVLSYIRLSASIQFIIFYKTAYYNVVNCALTLPNKTAYLKKFLK